MMSKPEVFALMTLMPWYSGGRALAIGPRHIKRPDLAHPVLDYQHLFSQITGKTQSTFNGFGMIVISVNHMNFWSLQFFVEILSRRRRKALFEIQFIQVLN